MVDSPWQRLFAAHPELAQPQAPRAPSVWDSVPESRNVEVAPDRSGGQEVRLRMNWDRGWNKELEKWLASGRITTGSMMDQPGFTGWGLQPADPGDADALAFIRRGLEPMPKSR